MNHHSYNVWYFGCLDQAGHFIHQADGRRVRAIPNAPDAASAAALDGFIETQADEGEIRHRCAEGWTYLGYADRSFDKRTGSKSVFAANGEYSIAQMLGLARTCFPRVRERGPRLFVRKDDGTRHFVVIPGGGLGAFFDALWVGDTAEISLKNSIDGSELGISVTPAQVEGLNAALDSLERGEGVLREEAMERLKNFLVIDETQELTAQQALMEEVGDEAQALLAEQALEQTYAVREEMRQLAHDQYIGDRKTPVLDDTLPVVDEPKPTRKGRRRR